MKQTAVEWLRSKMLIECLEPSDELFEQAKAMEKEQIAEAFDHVDSNLDDGLHYYEQTFKDESNTRI